MSYYAEILTTEVKDITTKIVKQVIAADNTVITNYPGVWIQVSYNTRGGIHYGQNGQPDGGVALRGNYPAPGYIYDDVNDVFYAPQPFPSWTISGPSWIWSPPIPIPTDGKSYGWNETTQTWDAWT